MLLVDSHEETCCPELVNQLRKSIQVVVTNLNISLMSDYYFSNYEGRRFQYGRVQAMELLSNIDSMEDELSRYYENAEVNGQIIEGLISPIRIKNIDIHEHSKKVDIRNIGSTIYGYKIHPNGVVEGHAFSGITASMYYAWIHRLAMAGIATYHSDNYIETARLIITLYKNEGKPATEHSTLQRVIVPKIQLRQASEFVKALIFIGHAYKLDIGEVKANALAEKFVNIADLATASIDDVANVDKYGKNSAAKLLRALRGEV